MAPTIGVEIEHAGHRAQIALIESEGVVLQIGLANLRVPYGSSVRVNGHLVRLVPNGPQIDTVVRAREALRTWRSQRSMIENKSADTYLTDETLETVASTMPSTMTDLSKINGIGAAKLDAYGDEILANVDSARDG